MKFGFTFLMTILLVVNTFAQVKTTKKAAPKAKETGQESITISQFERAGESDFLIDRNNHYHVVFQESPAIGKPVFIYYTMSTNNGVSWSKPITLSNDGTGNGASPPSLIQDGNGAIYAIWKRYGNKGSKYPAPDVSLDGRGGYVNGTLFYKVLQGGNWSQQFQISDEEGSQFSWFPFLNQQGQLYICWNEVSPASVANNWLMWYYADWIRFAKLETNGVSAKAEISAPSAPTYKGGAPPHNGVINLHGYADKEGNVHYIYNRKAEDKTQKIYYYNGKKHEEVYTYPLYGEGNTFMNPPRLLYDEKGLDHVIFQPSASTLESEQLWDLTPINKQKNILADIQAKGIRIAGFQANQAEGGKMNIAIQAGDLSNSTEAYGFFYANGKWDKRGLTKNAAKENFVYAQLTPLTYLATITKYNAKHGAVALTKEGKKKMVMTLNAQWSSGGYSVSNPSLIFIHLDK